MQTIELKDGRITVSEKIKSRLEVAFHFQGLENTTLIQALRALSKYTRA